MARPKKKGLDYFPVDTNIFQDLKIRRLIRQYSHRGLFAYFCILCDIYNHSFYLKLSKDYHFELAERLDLSERAVLNMIRFMVEIGLFNENLHNRGVLTSCAIQERYFMVKGKNINLEDSKKELLLTSICTGKNRGFGCEKYTKKRKEKKIIISLITRTREEEAYRKDWAEWREELLSDAIWQETLVRFSGKGAAVLQYAGEAMALFEDFIVLRGEISSHRTKRDYQRSFLNWWRYNNWTLEMDVLRGQKTRQKETRPVARKLGMMDKAEAAAEKASVLALKFLNGEAI